MEELNSRIAFLAQSNTSHFNLASLAMPSGQVTSLGMYAWVALKRSISLVQGFVVLMEKNNVSCAASLIRLQIDNLLRFRALSLVSDIDQFVLEIFSGEETRNILDRSGKKMRDVYLQEVFSSEYPWLKDYYKIGSGFVHLSNKHFHSTISAKGKEGQIQMYVGPDDPLATSEGCLEIVEAMIMVTHSLLCAVQNTVTSNFPPEETN